MADSGKHEAGTVCGRRSPSLSLLEMQQSLMEYVKRQQYTEALSMADQILKLHQHSPVMQDLRRILADKVELDRNAVNDEDRHSNKESSDSASGIETESEDEEDDSSEAASTSESDSESTFAAEAVCDTLHVSLHDHVLSASQRKQIKDALKEQLEDLRVQQASQHMQILGL